MTQTELNIAIAKCYSLIQQPPVFSFWERRHQARRLARRAARRARRLQAQQVAS